MRRLLAVAALAGALGSGAAPVAAGDPPAARIDPNFPPLRSVMPGAGGAVPTVPGYVVPPQRPQVYCDPYGRCWRQVPGPRGPHQGQPPDWNNSRPRPSRDPYGFDGPD